MAAFLPFLVAFLITVATTPLVIKLAVKYGLVDDPKVNPHPKKIHSRVIPRAGGLAIYIAIFLSTLVFFTLTKALVGILLGISFLLIIGLLDDKLRNFSPYLRLFFLFVAAAAPVFAGIGISFISNPIYHFLPSNHPLAVSYIRFDSVIIPIEFFGKHNIVLFADILAFLWIVTLTQVINWAKGVDGQMPGITLVSSLVLGFLSLKLFNQGDVNQLEVAKLSFIVAGTSLGFLIFNWYPSKILPGFSASTILAFMLAVLSILSGAKLATAALALGIPIIDFLYTFFRRIWQKKSPVWGDRGHLHHKLLDKGLSHRQISLFYMAGSAILGSVALISSTEGKFFAFLGLGVAILIFILWLSSFGGLFEPFDQGNG